MKVHWRGKMTRTIIIYGQGLESVVKDREEGNKCFVDEAPLYLFKSRNMSEKDYPRNFKAHAVSLKY